MALALAATIVIWVCVLRPSTLGSRCARAGWGGVWGVGGGWVGCKPRLESRIKEV